MGKHFIVKYNNNRDSRLIIELDRYGKAISSVVYYSRDDNGYYDKFLSVSLEKEELFINQSTCFYNNLDNHLLKDIAVFQGQAFTFLGCILDLDILKFQGWEVI